MATQQLSRVVQHLRGMLAMEDAAGIPDADLLKRYVHERDEAAFEMLVRRHGPMVLGVCRRLLHNPHDAEDAFQVTFLVLVRKASTLHSPSTIGNWLYGVAYRTALEVRKASAKRRAKEAMAPPRTEMPQDHRADLQLMLDQELKRLPDKHREVVVLCDLEGKTRKEAALDLGCAEGTVASRLARARTVLAKRLTRQGLSLSAGAMAVLLSENAASGCLPPSVISSTIKAAGAYAAGPAAAGAISANVAALTQGVLRTMLLTKLKIATAVLVAITVVGVGAGSLIYQTQGAEDSKEKGNAASRDQPKLLGQEARDRSADAAKEQSSSPADDLRGDWSGEKDGVKVKLTFYDPKAKWHAHWQVEYKRVYKRSPKSEFPAGLTGIEVNKGADLKCAANPTVPERLDLFLPIYLGAQKEIKESSWNGRVRVGYVDKVDKETLRLGIIPTGYENPAEQNYDFPAVEGLVLHPEGRGEKKAAASAEEQITVEALPPVVVKTVPQAGLTNVDAKTTEIQVTFSKEMMDESWSWSLLSDDTFPKIIGKPKYLKDKRTCVVTVKLEPDKTYAIWVNSEKFGNFKDAEGRSAVSYLLVFKTAK